MQLTIEQVDALQELVNIGVGKAAAMLNEMIHFYIQLQIPYIKVLSPSMVKHELEERLGSHKISVVRLCFNGPFNGNAQLVFPTGSAAQLVAVLTEQDLEEIDLDTVKIGTLSEIGNILLNGVMGSISNILSQHLDYAIPVYSEDTVYNLWKLDEFDGQSTVILAQARFTVEQLNIEGDIILLFKMGSFEALLRAIAQKSEEHYEPNTSF